MRGLTIVAGLIVIIGAYFAAFSGSLRFLASASDLALLENREEIEEILARSHRRNMDMDNIASCTSALSMPDGRWRAASALWPRSSASELRRERHSSREKPHTPVMHGAT